MLALYKLEYYYYYYYYYYVIALYKYRRLLNTYLFTYMYICVHVYLTYKHYK